jgi:hypothetical protein
VKNFSTAILSAIREGARTELVEMQLATGPLRFTTANHDIEFAGAVYLSGGNFVEVGGIKQEQELRVNTCAFQISLVDQSVLALFQANNPIGRKVILRQVLCDDNDQVIGALLTTTMRIDTYAVDDDEATAGIGVQLSNYMAQYDAVRGIRTTQASYQRFYPNSTSFINSKSAGDDLRWGGR